VYVEVGRAGVSDGGGEGGILGACCDEVFTDYR
jgi:hypothetical protein